MQFSTLMSHNYTDHFIKKLINILTLSVVVQLCFLMRSWTFYHLIVHLPKAIVNVQVALKQTKEKRILQSFNIHLQYGHVGAQTI